MSATDTGAAPIPSGGRRRRRGSSWLLAAALVVAAAGVPLAVADPFASDPARPSATAGSSGTTGLERVARESLSSQSEVSATLGYAGSYTVVNQAQGTVTSLPEVGQVVGQGQVLYEVNGNPVVLLYGTTPAYRTLSEGMTGADVGELDADLVALGDATAGEISPGTDAFTSATAAALGKLQGALGTTESGTLTLGQAVFVPGPVRVTSVSGPLGGPAVPGQPIMGGTSTARQVSIALAATRQSEVKAGDEVTITLPNDRSTPGVISSVGTVAVPPAPGTTGNSSPTVTVLVTPSDPAATGTWDEAPVNVTITTGRVRDALVVPVDALLAEPQGAYAVEVAAGGGRHLVRVTLGLFDDANGLVQVGGSTLAAGQRVVVPKL
jgi:multidrug efflux pump subunit AcrA (membrane-fusion protein)